LLLIFLPNQNWYCALDSRLLEPRLLVIRSYRALGISPNLSSRGRLCSRRYRHLGPGR